MHHRIGVNRWVDRQNQIAVPHGWLHVYERGPSEGGGLHASVPEICGCVPVYCVTFCQRPPHCGIVVLPYWVFQKPQQERS